MKTKKCDCEKDFEKEIEKEFGKNWEEKLEKKFEKWGDKFEKYGSCCNTHSSSSFMGGGFYFLCFLGTAIYYIGQAPDFWMGVVGVLKALVWPAMLIYEVFTRLNM